MSDLGLVISQKGKRFGPSALNIHRDDRVTILNDDGFVIHHVYIEDDRYSFDSNDVEPRSKVVIPFPTSGDFMILCSIHPKMKLAVHVE